MCSCRWPFEGDALLPHSSQRRDLHAHAPAADALERHSRTEMLNVLHRRPDESSYEQCECFEVFLFEIVPCPRLHVFERLISETIRFLNVALMTCVGGAL